MDLNSINNGIKVHDQYGNETNPREAESASKIGKWIAIAGAAICAWYATRFAKNEGQMNVVNQINDKLGED